MANKNETLIDDFLTCSVCFEVFKEPKVLPCIHSFCEDCLQQYIAKNKLSSKQFTCPTCRQPSPLPSGKVSNLKTNFVLKNMIEVLTVTSEVKVQKYCSFCIRRNKTETAVSKCLTCSDLLCNFCAEHHNLTTLTIDHEVVTIQDVIAGKFSSKLRSLQQIPCTKHKGESMRFFCDTCSQPVCRDCVLLNHKSHEYLSPIEARKKKDSEIKTLMNNVSTRLETLANYNSKVTEKVEELEAKKMSIVDIVSDTCTRVMEYVLSSRKIAEKEIEILFERRKKLFSSASLERETEERELKDCVSLCNHILENGSDLEVLSLQNLMTERLFKLNTTNTAIENENIGTNFSVDIKINNEFMSNKLFVIDEHSDTNFATRADFKGVKHGAITKRSKSVTRIQDSKLTIPSDIQSDLLQKKTQYLLPKLVRIFEIKDANTTLQVDFVSWIDEDRFAGADKKENKLFIYSVSKHSIIKSTKVKSVNAIATFKSRIACKEQVGKLTIFDLNLSVDRKLDNVYGILSSIPESSSLVWTDKENIFIYEDGRTEERQFVDENDTKFRFDKPFRGCCLPNGNFAICDIEKNTLFLLNQKCKIYRRLKYSQGGICTDMKSNIYISNCDENFVYVVNSKGDQKPTWTMKQIAIFPKGLSINRGNKMVVVSHYQNAIIDIESQ